jgi:hypothetical protein
MPESYPLQYPLRKLFDEIYSFDSGSVTDNIIDLEGGVYYYNGVSAEGIDGIEYGPMDGTHASVDGYGAVRHFLRSNLQIKNGTIILYRPIQGDDLIDEGGGVYSFGHNMDYEPEPQIHDPGEDNVSKRPRLAKYPPQREDNLTNFSFDDNSWNNPVVVDENEEDVVQPITELFEDGKYYLTGIYVKNAGNPNIYQEMLNILDEIIVNESEFSTRQEAALGMAVSYRGIQNQINTTTINGYLESSTGVTYSYSDVGAGNLTESDLYHSAFNWFGRRTFFSYGATADSGVSVYTPVLNEDKILYGPARGSCTQIFASIDGISASISGLDEGAIPYWGHGFMYQTFSNEELEFDEEGYFTGFKHKVRYENIEFIGSLKDTKISGRGFLVGSNQKSGGSELEIIGCTFNKGPEHFVASYHGLTIENTSFLYPRTSIGNISSVGGCSITKSKFIGPEKSSCISTSNQDYDFKFTPKEMLIKGNYFNVKESNHGQAISSYANSYHKYRIIGNIFHNCQRALSLQSSSYAEWNWQLLGLSGDDGNPESMGDGYILANNLIYIDEIPVQSLSGQAGVAFNGAQPTAAKIFTVIDDGKLDDLIINEATDIVIQKRNPDGSFSDRNYTPELIAGPEPSLDPSAVNTHRFSFQNFDNTYFVRNTQTESDNIPTINGKKELYASSSEFNRSNFWLGLLDNPPEPLYLRLYNYVTDTTYAEGITVDSVKFLRNPPKVTVKRNTAILSRNLATEYDAEGPAFELNAVNGIATNWSGSSDLMIIDAEGNDRQ